jgi:hypothetical protein
MLEMGSAGSIGSEGSMEMVRRINQSAALLYEEMPAAGMQYRGID